MKPRFLSLEGTEGCGKSTQILRLKERLEKAGFKVVLTREPGGTPLGETLRELIKHSPEGRDIVPQAELLLFAASRAQLARRVIAPALESGAWVISDRYFDSSWVYQGIARRLSPDTVDAINRFAVGSAIPGLTLILDISLEESRRRLQHRARPVGQVDHLEAQPQEFFERVREGYLQLAQKESERVQLISAEQSPEAVEAAIWEKVKNAFQL